MKPSEEFGGETAKNSRQLKREPDGYFYTKKEAKPYFQKQKKTGREDEEVCVFTCKTTQKLKKTQKIDIPRSTVSYQFESCIHNTNNTAKCSSEKPLFGGP